MDTYALLSLIFGIAFTIACFAILNLLRKVEAYEDSLNDVSKYQEDLEKIILQTKKNIEETYQTMRQIDRLGAFEADDEIGTAFKNIKQVIDNLNETTSQLWV